jgi:hypothetical protein
MARSLRIYEQVVTYDISEGRECVVCLPRGFKTTLTKTTQLPLVSLSLSRTCCSCDVRKGELVFDSWSKYGTVAAIGGKCGRLGQWGGMSPGGLLLLALSTERNGKDCISSGHQVWTKYIICLESIWFLYAVAQMVWLSVYACGVTLGYCFC